MLILRYLNEFILWFYLIWFFTLYINNSISRGSNVDSKLLSKQVGQRMQEKRKELDLTQEQMAERIGISQQSLSSKERGISAPKFERLPDCPSSLWERRRQGRGWIHRFRGFWSDKRSGRGRAGGYSWNHRTDGACVQSAQAIGSRMTCLLWFTGQKLSAHARVRLSVDGLARARFFCFLQ